MLTFPGTKWELLGTHRPQKDVFHYEDPPKLFSPWHNNRVLRSTFHTEITSSHIASFFFFTVRRMRFFFLQQSFIQTHNVFTVRPLALQENIAQTRKHSPPRTEKMTTSTSQTLSEPPAAEQQRKILLSIYC